MKYRPIFLALLGLSASPALAAQTNRGSISTPAPGTALRQDLLNAVRVPVMRTFSSKNLSFKVTGLQVSGPWAFVQARPMNAAHEFLRDPQSGAPEVWALLHRTAAGWQVLRWAMPTDVISVTWEKELPQVPRNLWPHHRW